MRRKPSYITRRALAALVLVPTTVFAQSPVKAASVSSSRGTLADFASRLVLSADSAVGFLDFYSLKLQIAALEAIRSGDARGLPSSFETIGSLSMTAATEMPQFAEDFDASAAPIGLERSKAQLVVALRRGAIGADSLFAATVSCRRRLVDVAQCQLRFMKASSAISDAKREYAEARSRGAGLLKMQGFTLADRVTFEEHGRRAIAPKGGPGRHTRVQLDTLRAKLESTKSAVARAP